VVISKVTWFFWWDFDVCEFELLSVGLVPMDGVWCGMGWGF
jgi:hypothetical protein